MFSGSNSKDFIDLDMVITETEIHEDSRTFLNVVLKGNGGFVENNVALEIKFFDRCKFVVQQ